MYLDICTVKGCSQRADACRVKKVILINENENESEFFFLINSYDVILFHLFQ